MVHRPAEFAHRVELDPVNQIVADNGVVAWKSFAEKPAWTLFITGKKQREWGFHCPKGWMHWEKFTEGGTPTDARNSLGCGELS